MHKLSITNISLNVTINFNNFNKLLLVYLNYIITFTFFRNGKPKGRDTEEVQTETYRLNEKTNAAYLAKERERRRKSYVPNNQLSRKQRSFRNKKNRTYSKTYRALKRTAHIQQQGIAADLLK